MEEPQSLNSHVANLTTAVIDLKTAVTKVVKWGTKITTVSVSNSNL